MMVFLTLLLFTIMVTKYSLTTATLQVMRVCLIIPTFTQFTQQAGFQNIHIITCEIVMKLVKVISMEMG